jgi:hypothetical protein
VKASVDTMHEAASNENYQDAQAVKALA